ncbi:hypothetical protein GCM10028808_42180 [Spirosoma migulaei]
MRVSKTNRATMVVQAILAAVAAIPDFIINNLTSNMEYKYITASIVYSLLGIAILIISFVIIEKLTPENLWKKILDEQNVALAILAAAFMIAVSIIISSAIHG